MSDQPPPDEAGDPMAVASYVASLAADLSAMTRRTGLESLNYLLELVLLEAENLSRHVPHRANGGR